MNSSSKIITCSLNMYGIGMIDQSVHRSLMLALLSSPVHFVSVVFSFSSCLCSGSLVLVYLVTMIVVGSGLSTERKPTNGILCSGEESCTTTQEQKEWTTQECQKTKHTNRGDKRRDEAKRCYKE